MISERRVKTDVNLMRWIGDNYKPSSSPQGWQDAPAFSNRVKTDTPEFKRWFGDSKVVDEQGRPLVVYHGTNADVEEFAGSDFVGWFAKEPGLAERYLRDASAFSAPNVMPVYLAIKNPLRLKTDMNDSRQAAMDELAKLGFDADTTAYGRGPSAYAVLADSHLAEQLFDKGFDGVFVKEDGVDTYAPIFAPQIKSATGNSGAFDPANPDIRFSQRARAVSTEVPDQDVFEEFGRFAENRIDADRAWADGDHVFAVAEMDEEPTPVTSPQMLAAYTPDQLMIIRARDWSPSEPAAPDQAEVASLFRDLQDARGLGRVRALERVDVHPMAETIRRIGEEFMDILERLDDAGLVKINCK
jgi:hypothetical protein